MGKTRKPENAWLPKRVYEHHGSYRFHTATGERINLGRDYPKAIAKWAQLVGRIGPMKDIGEVMDRYLIEIAPMKAPRTYQDNIREMANLRAVFGHIEPDDIRPPMIYQYMDERGATVRANRELTLLSLVYQQAIKWGKASGNPCLLVDKNPEFPRDNPVSDDELKLIREVATPMLRAYLDVKYLTGLRKGDILQLKREHIRADGLYVAPGKNQRRHPKTGKVVRKKERLYQWTDELRDAINRALALQRVKSLYVFAKRDGQSYYNAAKGQAWTFDNYWKRIRARAFKLAEQRGVAFHHFTEHDIRAKAGTDAQNATGEGAKLLGNTEAQFQRAYKRGVETVTPLRKKPAP